MWRNPLFFANATALCILGFRCLLSYEYAAAVILVSTTSTPSLAFRSTQARFASPLKASGVSGSLVLEKPEADACTPLEYVSDEWGSSSAILLATQGSCPADTKSRHAQDAGFTAIIIYANDSNHNIVASEALAKYADNEGVSVQILPDYEDTIWSVIVFMLILLLAIAAGLVTWCFVKRNRSRRRLRFKGPCVISSRIVEAMPTEVYKVIGNEKAAQESCTICLEEYIPGETLRILPCSHRFHASCVDAWLTLWRAVCPMCKRDARYEFPDLQASERTPLLSFAPIWASSLESPPIQIPPSHSNFLNSYLSSSSWSKGGASTSKPYQPPLSESSLNEFRRFTSLQSSLEAFRASPYFTPPSLSHNPSPLLPGYAYSPTVGSLSRYSYSSSRDLGGKSFLNPKRENCASPLAGSYSSPSYGSQSTYLNPRRGNDVPGV